MAKKLTILFAPVEGVGHVNASIGLGECLRDRGNKIVFVIEKSWTGRLERYGFVEEIVENPNAQDKIPGEEGALRLLETGLISGASALEKIKIMSNENFFKGVLDVFIAYEPILKAIVAKHNPDLYIIDHMIGSPTLIYSGKPWILICSGNPLYVFDDERTPPTYSGYPSDGDKSNWPEFRREVKLFDSIRFQYNDWLKENGFPTLDNNRCIPDSPYLNLYGYPEELDYTDIRPVPDNWFRIDSFMRKGEEELKIPEEFTVNNAKNIKLIYVSLGSMGCIDIELMKRLVKILAKTAHKYIVSKGILGDRYELPDNMWGQKSVPQTKVLPLIDLVLTHGGNNTIYETFSCGKPMLVLPIFADQFDNAQRVQEKGFGLRLDPYNCSEQELLNAIESLLIDEELKQRLSIASKRIQNSNSLSMASELIEKLVK